MAENLFPLSFTPTLQPSGYKKNTMKIKLIFSFTLLFVLAVQYNTVQAQFLKKLKNKVEKKLNDVLETDDQNNEQNDAASATSDNGYNSSQYEADYGDFVAGNTVIFKDTPGSDEVEGTRPLKWGIFNSRKTDNTEIVEVDGVKMIRLAKNQGISPVVPGKEKDYIPGNFTLEFDAGFSAGAPDQRYYVVFFDLENQNDFVDWDVRDAELTLTTFGVTDNLTEGTVKGHKCFEASPAPVWRHIAIKYQHNTFEIYYDGRHIFHKGNLKGNMIGLTISRSEFGTDDRYIKNVVIATDQ